MFVSGIFVCDRKDRASAPSTDHGRPARAAHSSKKRRADGAAVSSDHGNKPTLELMGINFVGGRECYTSIKFGRDRSSLDVA